jgi:hypothetical protein
MNFNKGDKVVCLDAGCYASLTEGATYEVQRHTHDSEFVQIVNDFGGEDSFFATRFKLVEETTPEATDKDRTLTMTYCGISVAFDLSKPLSKALVEGCIKAFMEDNK